MGIYDREYYRREGPGFLRSFTEHGQMCKWLILINIALFVLQIITFQPQVAGLRDVDPDDDVAAFSWGPVTNTLELDTDRVLKGQVWRLVTYAFLHSPTTYWHILWNMLFLWWFGADVEDIYGPRELLALYLVSALIGGVAFVACNLAGVPGDRCVGASGVVMTVIVLCALHFPDRVIMLFYFLPVPIWFFVLFALVPDAYTFLMALRTGQQTGQTAVSVHLAGAAFGYLYFKQQWRLTSLWSGLSTWQRQRSRPRLRVYHEEEPAQPVPVATAAAADVDEQLEAKLDAVLEKVARSGQDSLTDSERQILLRASERYKKRRT